MRLYQFAGVKIATLNNYNVACKNSTMILRNYKTLQHTKKYVVSAGIESYNFLILILVLRCQWMIFVLLNRTFLYKTKQNFFFIKISFYIDLLLNKNFVAHFLFTEEEVEWRF